MGILVRVLIERDDVNPNKAVISIDVNGAMQVTTSVGPSAEALLDALEGADKLGVWLPE